MKDDMQHPELQRLRTHTHPEAGHLQPMFKACDRVLAHLWCWVLHAAPAGAPLPVILALHLLLSAHVPAGHDMIRASMTRHDVRLPVLQLLHFRLLHFRRPAWDMEESQGQHCCMTDAMTVPLQELCQTETDRRHLTATDTTAPSTHPAASSSASMSSSFSPAGMR
jgi:hypothetical protein